MLLRQSLLLIAGIVLLGAAGTFAKGQNWAVLVAGSNGWYNYRHQADVCHAYQILHKNGIPDSNIIVMMYDDLSKNKQNPTPGSLINQPNGKDVYKGVPHDYVGAAVTPQNFINVLLGKKDALVGAGSGKVLNSGPDDNVFIFFTDHGATGLVAFPNGVLYAKDLNKTITQMHAANKYKEMVIYIEACESGSMLEDILATNINIYATTASNAEESSYACYYDDKRGTYLGDLYSVNWMEDSDAEDITKETLFKQFQITKKKTNESHVMQYGDLKLGATRNVNDFQAMAMNGKSRSISPLVARKNDLLKRDSVATQDVRQAIISRRLAADSTTAEDRDALERQLAAAIQQQQLIDATINMIARQSLAVNRGDFFEMVTTQRMQLTQHDCYIHATQRIHEKCFDLPNEYVLNKLWIVANLCEIGLQDFTINNAVDAVCDAIGHQDFDY